MSTSTLALIVSAVSLFTVVTGQVIANLLPLRRAAKEREAAQKKELVDRLIRLDRLIELRGQLQFFQGGRILEREIFYGEAYAILLAVSDDRLLEWANLIMDGDPEHREVLPNRPGSVLRNEKLTGIDNGIKILSEIIREATKK